VYSHSFIKYKITSKNIYEAEHAANVPPELIKPISEKMHYGAYGTFINVKIGKRFVFFNFSLAAYYQDYGKYKLLGGSSKTLQGISIIPSYGIQFNILTKKEKNCGDIRLIRQHYTAYRDGLPGIIKQFPHADVTEFCINLFPIEFPFKCKVNETTTVSPNILIV